jgi:hypothetical protein
VVTRDAPFSTGPTAALDPVAMRPISCLLSPASFDFSDQARLKRVRPGRWCSTSHDVSGEHPAVARHGKPRPLAIAGAGPIHENNLRYWKAHDDAENDCGHVSVLGLELCQFGKLFLLAKADIKA